MILALHVRWYMQGLFGLFALQKGRIPEIIKPYPAYCLVISSFDSFQLPVLGVIKRMDCKVHTLSFKNPFYIAHQNTIKIAHSRSQIYINEHRAFAWMVVM